FCGNLKTCARTRGVFVKKEGDTASAKCIARTLRVHLACQRKQLVDLCGLQGLDREQRSGLPVHSNQPTSSYGYRACGLRLSFRKANSCEPHYSGSRSTSRTFSS